MRWVGGVPWHVQVIRKIEAARASPVHEFTPEQRSLLKLAVSSARLHAAALSKDCVPRDDDGNSQPLALMKAALDTLRKGVLHEQRRLP
jgi:hypothetical protein